MKLNYEAPVMEITMINNESIITASGGGLVGEGGIGGGLIDDGIGDNEFDF